MKNKRVRMRMIANLMVLLLVFSYATVAANAATPRASDYISSYSGGIYWSGSNLKVSFDIVATGRMTTLGAGTIVIQKWTSNGWSPVKTFYSSSTSGMTGSNTTFYGGTVTYYSAPTGTYRAKISFYAGNSNGSDSKILYTNVV